MTRQVENTMTNPNESAISTPRQIQSDY